MSQTPAIRDRVRELRRVPASELRPNPRNWRTHPTGQRAALEGVLAEIGYADALLARELPDGSLELIDGHLRRDTTPDALVPVLVVDVSEAEANLLLASLDPLAALAGADAQKLDALLREVSTGDEALQGMLAELAEKSGLASAQPEPGAGGDDFDAAPQEEGPLRTALGDLWQVGEKHRLFVGDCTVRENVERLMGGVKVGLCFTSPPYAQQRDYGARVEDWDALMQGAFACLPIADDGQVLVNLGLVHREGEWWPYWDGWIAWMREQGWRRFGWYVWDQGWGLPGDWAGRLAPSFEFTFHFNRQSIRPEKWVDSKYGGQSTTGKRGLRGTDGRVTRLNHASGPNGDYTYPDNKIPDSVIRVNRQCGQVTPGESHPAPFSVELPQYVIRSWPADVYDQFLGSGTTLIAAHRLGRTCYGCELEPRYADVVLKRAEAEGLTVKKVEG